MNKIVARNVRNLREKNNLSMDQLVRLSGVSKSMLAQIERGEANPTISTLWKLLGIRTSFKRNHRVYYGFCRKPGGQDRGPDF